MLRAVVYPYGQPGGIQTARRDGAGDQRDRSAPCDTRVKRESQPMSEDVDEVEGIASPSLPHHMYDMSASQNWRGVDHNEVVFGSTLSRMSYGHECAGKASVPLEGSLHSRQRSAKTAVLELDPVSA